MGFSRQKYWSGLPCPPPGDLPDSGTKPMSLMSLHWQEFFTTEPSRKKPQFHSPQCIYLFHQPQNTQRVVLELLIHITMKNKPTNQISIFAQLFFFCIVRSINQLLCVGYLGSFLFFQFCHMIYLKQSQLIYHYLYCISGFVPDS